jgi:hypothetical protein
MTSSLKQAASANLALVSGVCDTSLNAGELSDTSAWYRSVGHSVTVFAQRDKDRITSTEIPSLRLENLRLVDRILDAGAYTGHVRR